MKTSTPRRTLIQRSSKSFKLQVIYIQALLAAEIQARGLPWGVWTGPHGDAECGASDSSVLSAFGPHVRATLGDQSQIGIGT